MPPPWAPIFWQAGFSCPPPPPRFFPPEPADPWSGLGLVDGAFDFNSSQDAQRSINELGLDGSQARRPPSHADDLLAGLPFSPRATQDGIFPGALSLTQVIQRTILEVEATAEGHAEGHLRAARAADEDGPPPPPPSRPSSGKVGAIS